jgi:hypothetical protein
VGRTVAIGLVTWHMDELGLTSVAFEAIPLERVKTESVRAAVDNILNVLQYVGFTLVQLSDKSKNIKIVEISDKARVKRLAKAVFAEWEDELVWLTTEFFQTLFIVPTKHDLLFGLASSKDAKQVGPYGRAPDYIVSEVGDYTYRPAIPRILISSALAQHGFEELGKSLECVASFPRETALAGQIIFVDPPIKYDLKMIDSDTGFEWRALSILSSRSLSQGIVELLQDDAKLDQVELAKAFPFQLFSVAATEEAKPFTLFNHFSVRARKGTFFEVVDELLGVSLHLNWALAKEYARQIPKEKAVQYALMQNSRLKHVEEKEQRLRYSISVLQRRYPARTQLLEWEVNNLYSNVVRFSPVYLSWKIHLRTFIQDEDYFEHGLLHIIGQLDWSALEKAGVASVEDGQKIVDLLRVDPASTLTKMRVIIEKIVSVLYRREFPNRSQKIPLATKIQRLQGSSIFPSFIRVFLNTLRLTGNIGAHEGSGQRKDVEAILPIFSRTVEWFTDVIGEPV